MEDKKYTPENRIISDEQYLSLRLHLNEKYGKMELRGNHLSHMYDNVNDYLLYRFFQSNESLTEETGLDLIEDVIIN